MREVALSIDEHAPSGTAGWWQRWGPASWRLDASLAALIVIVMLGIVTRFAMLGTRVMSHDETTHVYFSWLLEQGRGYTHDPLSHGPVQFHVIALSYFLFGDNDATARVPAAIAGVLALILAWKFHRWIGRPGAAITAALMFASPFMLYYGRYARNEAFVVVEALLMFYAVFRYLEARQARHLFLLAAALTLHSATKETFFIYGAQLIVLLVVLLVLDLVRKPWENRSHFFVFLFGLAVTLLGALPAVAVYLKNRNEAGDQATVPVSPIFILGSILAILGFVLVLSALILAYGRRLRTEFPALDLLVVSLTVFLPQIGAFPAQALGWDPLAYTDPSQWSRTALVVLILSVVTIGLGLAWDWRRWLVVAGIFAAIYVPLYTTLFTNPFGFFTGMVGSLGYWLVQQGVERGSQPWYYYGFLQVPVYEFLPAIGALAAVVMLLFRRSRQTSEAPAEESGSPVPGLYPIFFLYWALTSLVLYTFAGERMPWLTVHIALPLIMLAGWAFSRFLAGVSWSRFREPAPWILAALFVFGLLSFFRAMGYALGDPPPFQGMTLEQLKPTTGLITSALFALAAAVGAYQLRRGWANTELAKLAGVVALGGLFLLTLRAGLRASFVNYDDATEYLVYAHTATGPKLALAQIEELSRRTTDGLNIDLGYDNLSTYPFWWYLRDYPNAHFFNDTPSREILNYPVILAGQGNYAQVDAILRNRYYAYEYNRVWWPMQDYFGLTWPRIRDALTSPAMRAALWDIWLNRDYTAYGQLIGRDFSLRNWDPAEKLRLYVRKDVASLVWNYGVAPAVLEPVEIEDPYEGKISVIEADQILGQSGDQPGQFKTPRDLAVAPDGTLYIADTGNHRIQHLSPGGEVLHTWGTFAALDQGEAPGGTFNEPWGVAVAPDGTVYVADTWNNRVQRFSADGTFLGMFGFFGQAEEPEAFWGPRAVAVDPDGRLFVADTGNKRVVIFDADGQPLGEVGAGGALIGLLNEPVGLAVNASGRLYVADTWNQRIQAFEETEPYVFESVLEIPLDGWLGQSLDNKPYLDVSPAGRVCTTDPEGFRVLCFLETGEFAGGWGEPGPGISQFGLPVGFAFDAGCEAWVTDSRNERLMHFALPSCL
ncbi:MAG TPA: flippase activity-associated protein Agl23 [Anaerolineales bacterium]|nr:flippase activity-associated protein Agl23 [Anaerolineales bacterium]